MRLLWIATAILCCVSCKRTPSETVFIDPALAVLVPSDTRFLAGIRMQRLRAIPDWQRPLATSPRLLEFRKNTGLPASSDVWEYLVTSNGSMWLALMRGKFTEMGMEPRLDKPGARRLMYGGVTVLGDDHGAVGFLNPTTAIAGRLEAVIYALDRRNESAGVPEALERLAGEISSANELWFVSTGIAPGFLPVASVKSARGGIEGATRMLAMVVEAESEGAARSIAEVVHGSSKGTRVETKTAAPPAVLNWLLGSDAVTASNRRLR